VVYFSQRFLKTFKNVKKHCFRIFGQNWNFWIFWKNPIFLAIISRDTSADRKGTKRKNRKCPKVKKCEKSVIMGLAWKNRLFRLFVTLLWGNICFIFCVFYTSRNPLDLGGKQVKKSYFRTFDNFFRNFLGQVERKFVNVFFRCRTGFEKQKFRDLSKKGPKKTKKGEKRPKMTKKFKAY